MKFIVISDVHAHNWPQCSTIVDGINSRLLDTTLALQRVLQYMLKYKIKHLMNCGDLFHVRGKPPTEAVNLMLNSMREFHAKGIRSYILRGNHDTSVESNHHSLHPFRQFCTVIGRSTRFDLGGIEAVGIPYCSSQRELDEGLALVKRGSTKLLFMHQGVGGVPLRSGYIPGEMMKKSQLPKKTIYNILGHYHEHQFINSNSFYVGSLAQQNWGDEGIRKFFCEVTVQPKDSFSNAVRLVPSGCPEFKSLCGKSIGGARGNFTRVHLHSSERLQVPTIRGMLQRLGARHVEFKYTADSTTAGASTPHHELGVGKQMIRKFVKTCDTILDRKRLREIGEDILGQVQADGGI